MKNHRYIIILAASAIIAMDHAAVRAEDASASLYTAEPGRILLYTGDSVKAIPVDGRIEHSCYGDGGIYYIKIKEENHVATAYIGFIDCQVRELRYEQKLPLNLAEGALKKLMASGGIAFILTENKPAPGAGGELYRININSMEVARVSNVIDFRVQGRDLFLLVKNQEAVSVILNASTVPITLTDAGMLRITDIIDGRMVFITNGEESEIIDIRSGKNLYRYSGSYQTLVPDEYSLAIQAVDVTVADSDDREMIFYKVFVDGVESGRTDCGPAKLLREFRTRLESNKYHLIKLERWVLNTSKGRYDRVNNVHQPKSQQIFMPMNRVVKLTIKFNGKGYAYDTAPVYR